MNDYVMNHEPYTKLINIWCAGTGWRVVWVEPHSLSKDGDASYYSVFEVQPCIDPVSKRASIPKPSPYWTQDEYKAWFGIIMHELGHGDPEMIGMMHLALKEELSMQTFFGFVLNFIEDYRQEKHKLGEYKGRDEALSFMQGHKSKMEVESVTKFIDSGGTKDEKAATLCKLLAWLVHERCAWQPDVIESSHAFDELIDYSQFDKYKERLNNLGPYQEQDVLQLTRDIIDEDHNAEEEEQAAKQAGEGGEPVEGEQEGGEGEGDANSESRNEEEARLQALLVKYSDIIDHTSSGSEESDGTGVKIVYDHTTDHNFIPNSNSQTIDCTGKTDRRPNREMKALYVRGENLAGTTRRLLQTLSQSMYLPGHRRGKINGRALHAVPAGRLDVFRKKYDGLCNDTAVTVLVDMSGSMNGSWGGSGTKYDCAAAAAAALNDAISVNGFPLEIIGFTERGSTGPQHFIYKTFDNRVTSENIMGQFNRHRGRAYQNSDGESIIFAFNRLIVRKEKRKVLITLSDGQPACDNPGDAYTYTKDVVEFVSKHVDTYGIGIRTDAVKEFYPEYTVLRNPDELEKCLLEVVTTKIVSKK